MESGDRNRPTVELVHAIATALELDARDAGELLIAAGYAPMFADDRTIRQLAVLLTDAPEETVVMLRAMVSAGYQSLPAVKGGEAS